MLGELSFASYRELGCDGILYVEGPTDCATLRVLLRQYGKDHKYAVFSLGGSSTINDRSKSELEEIKRIASRVAVLIDCERTSEDDDLPTHIEAFRKNCLDLGFLCHVLQRRAIENYFPEHAIQRGTKSQKCHALEPYEKLSEAKHSWGKNQNHEIARHMTKEDLAGTDLGKFLEELE